MPAPVGAPLPARVVTPPASAPPAEMMSDQPATASEPAQDDAQLAMAPPPPPAPSAASNDDVQASGALEAPTDSSAPTPLPAKRAPALVASPLVLPAPPQDQSLRVERAVANPPATNEVPRARAAPLTAPTAATALGRERQVAKPQPEASRATSSPQTTGNAATQQARQRRDEDARGETHRTTVLKLSTLPREWLAGYSASAGIQAPETIRIMAATPNAAAVQTWAAQLRHRLKQRGWATQIALAQDSNLTADELRLELSGAAPSTRPIIHRAFARRVVVAQPAGQHMVAPVAVQLQVAPRVAFDLEAKPLQHTRTAQVLRNVLRHHPM